MASKRPKLPPETAEGIPTNAAGNPAHVHVLFVDDAWAVRVRRRVVGTFAEQEDATGAAIRLARENGARVFLHMVDGRVRELSTSDADLLMFEIWKDIHAHHTRQTD